MDIHTLHTEAELTHLLRLIQDVKAKAADPHRRQWCEELENMVIAVGRAMKSARAAIEDDLGRKEGVRESVQACILVASFIAGVQTQIISLTHQSNNNGLQFTANLFAFVGMTLDVIGASSGVVCTILLRRSVERSRSLLMHFNELRRRIYANTERICTNPDAQNMDKIAKEMVLLLSLCKKVERVAVPDALQAILKIMEMLQTSAPLPLSGLAIHPQLTILYIINKGLPGFALIPFVTIAIGTLCLLVSVLAFAAISQHRGVWVTCLAITGASLTLLLILMVLNIPSRQRETEYRGLEQSLREALRRN